MNIFDNDLSRILTSYIAHRYYPTSRACFRLISRKGYPLEQKFAPLIDKRLNYLKESIQAGADQFISTHFPYLSFDQSYACMLKSYMEKTRIDVWWDKTLELSIRGPFSSTSLLTTPIQTILNELILETLSGRDIAQIKHRVMAGVNALDKVDPSRSGIVFSEIGSRRRINLDYQLEIISDVFQIAPERLIGTGNPYISNQLGLPLLGMMHHDYILAATANHVSNMKVIAERQALMQWRNTFGSFYDAAISDTFGLDHFLVAFDRNLSDSIQSVRHDSGDPINWAKRMQMHYKTIGIMSQEKRFIFTDSLDWSDISNIFSNVQMICRPSFGLGGNFTGAGSSRLINMSIKLIEFEGNQVRKLSDDPNKMHPEELAPMPFKNLLTIY
jgi:nicotinate phosphoribosyltransferase